MGGEREEKNVFFCGKKLAIFLLGFKVNVTLLTDLVYFLR